MQQTAVANTTRVAAPVGVVTHRIVSVWVTTTTWNWLNRWGQEPASDAVTTLPIVRPTKVNMSAMLLSSLVDADKPVTFADTQGCPNVIEGNYFDCA